MKQDKSKCEQRLNQIVAILTRTIGSKSMSPEWDLCTVNVCSNLLRHLDHMLVVGVPVAQGALGQDGDVGEDVEQSQARSYVRGCSEVVGAGIFAEEVT